MAKPLNYQTLGNFCGNLFDHVKVWPQRGFDPLDAPLKAREYWEQFAKHHESMPIRITTNGTFLHVYEGGGTDSMPHLLSVSMRTDCED